MQPVRELIVGTGAGAAQLGADVVLPLGPQHPSTHGVLRLRLTARRRADRVAAEPSIGFMHRGAEKLFEVRDYRQIIVLANRHDWLSAFGSELGVVLGGRADARHGGARAGGLAAHPAGRAQPGAQPPDVPGLLPARDRRDHAGLLRVPRARALQAVLEEATGGRIHYMFNRVGGLKEDVPAGWTDRARRRGRRRRPAELDDLSGNESSTRAPGRRAC